MSRIQSSNTAGQARLVISGLSGGGGKTLLSLGLARTLWRRGFSVKPYKKGPDYIDAAWLGLAAGRAATNLDPYFLDEQRLRALFADTAAGSTFAIIEGNRGLYDGRDLAGSCSTAHLARTLDAPVALALNCTKMTRTTAAIVAGLAAFEPIRLAGVVLNQVGSPRHAAMARKSIEHYTGIPVLGEIPRLRENPLPERHMGLPSIHGESPDAALHDEESETHAVLDALAELIRANCDVDALISLAQSAPCLPEVGPFWPPTTPDATDAADATGSGGAAASGGALRPRIGYVRDAALWFYYEENLEALRRAGARLVEVSLLTPAPWPELDGLYLGGGFPEVLAARLSVSPQLAEIKRLSEDNRPIYAECGGFMILCRALRVDGRDYPMADIFPARAEFRPKPQGLGYVEARVTGENPFHPLGAVLRGHEFHYSRCEALGELTAALRLDPGCGMGDGGRDGLVTRRTFAAYTHIFAPAVPHWAERFVAACRA